MNLEENIKLLNKIRIKKNHKLWVNYLQRVIELLKKEWKYDFYYDDKYNSICYKLNNIILIISIQYKKAKKIIVYMSLYCKVKDSPYKIKLLEKDSINQFKYNFDQILNMYKQTNLLFLGKIN